MSSPRSSSRSGSRAALAGAAGRADSPKAKGVRTDAGRRAAEKVASGAPQEVRIIGGQWRRTPLPVPVSSGLRPTPARVRETLFNWLGQDLQGWRVLDAYAGSGALGWEAASRGADEVVMLEREAALVRGLQAVKTRLHAGQVHIHQTDALTWMSQPAQAGRFDVVFLDPPFEAQAFDRALAAARRCVPEGGWVYLEASCAFEAQAGLALHRRDRAGAVHFHLFRRVEEEGRATAPSA